MSLVSRINVSSSPSSSRPNRAEWNALSIGLLLGVAFGLPHVYGRVLPTNPDAIVGEPQPEAAPASAIEFEVEPIAVPTTSDRRGSSVPVQWVSEQRAKSQTASAVAPMPRRKRMAPPVTGTRTLAYWKGLNEIIAREAEMRAPPPNITAGNAGAFLASRTKAAQYAAQAILNLDARNVDRELLVHAGNLADWYADEEKISARGSYLLDKSNVKTRQGAGGKQWKSHEEQHRQKCDELNERGKTLRARFSGKYELEFPPLL